ncbi:MAG: tetratricopeptide repeat protein [Phycisphaerales bacterium]|nr:tetratricopeptide repeat protein [Phycisphaerales bacterium]
MFSRYRRLILISFGLAGLLIMASVACRQEPRRELPAKEVVSVGKQGEAVASLAATKTPGLPERTEPRTTLSKAEAVSRLMADVQNAQGDFEKRVRARKALIYGLSRRGETDVAMLEFEAFLEDVEDQEGPERAGLGGATVARHLWRRGHYRTSIAVYERLQGDLLTGHAAAEALLYIGLSYAKLNEHKNAADSFQRIIREYSDSPLAPEARKELTAARMALHRNDGDRTALRVMAEAHQE